MLAVYKDDDPLTFKTPFSLMPLSHPSFNVFFDMNSGRNYVPLYVSIAPSIVSM